MLEYSSLNILDSFFNQINRRKFWRCKEFINFVSLLEEFLNYLCISKKKRDLRYFYLHWASLGKLQRNSSFPWIQDLLSELYKLVFCNHFGQCTTHIFLKLSVARSTWHFCHLWLNSWSDFGEEEHMSPLWSERRESSCNTMYLYVPMDRKPNEMHFNLWSQLRERFSTFVCYFWVRWDICLTITGDTCFSASRLYI